MQRLERHQRVDLPHHRLDQRTALVDLGHHPLSPVPLHRGTGGARPALRRGAERGRVLEHIGPPVGGRALRDRARHDDAAGVGACMRTHRGVDRDHDPVEIGRPLDHAGGQHRGGPQRPLGIGQQHAVELLPALPCPGVAATHLVQEARREIGGVRFGRRMGGHGAVGSQQVAQHRDVARGGGDAGARIAQPQPELQHVPRLLPAPPLGQLVGPGGVELRAAQRLGVMRREDLRRGAVGPSQHPAGRRPVRPPVGRRTGHEAAIAEDHHLTRLVERLADQRHASRPAGIARARTLHLTAHPFRPGPGLARAATAQDHPCPPVAAWRPLMRQRPEIEQMRQRRQRGRVEPVKKGGPLGSRRAGDPAGK